MRRALWAKHSWFSLLLLALALTLIAGACQAAPPAPEVQKVVETVVVEVEKEVEKVVEKEVEKEVVITATPVPVAQVATLDINLGAEPPNIDPSLATDTTSVQVVETLFLGLTNLNEQSEVEPELATDWSSNEDGTVWTFNMRDDVPWVSYNPATGEVGVVTDDEGNPEIVNAHDVVFGARRTCDPRTASDYSYVDYIIAGCQDVNTSEEEVTDETLEQIGVRAVDDFTVEFTLANPAGYFPAIAGMWINRPQPQGPIGEWGDRWVEPGFIQTNGPFALTEWVHHDHMNFVRNPHSYLWDDPNAGNVERISAVMVVESSTEFAMYENHELDEAGVPLPEIDRVRADPQLSQQLRIQPITCTYYYGFSTDKPPTDNPLVRKALGAAIDRVTLVEQVTKGGQLPANTFAPEGIFGNVASDPDIAPWYLDPELGKQRAAEWIAEAGFPDGAGLEITLMFNTVEAHRIIAEAVQAMWSEVFPQMTVNVENQEWGVYLQTINPTRTPVEQRPHVWRLGWCADYPDQNNWAYEVLNSRAGSNREALSEDDPFVGELVTQYNDLTEQAQASTDADDRAALYRQGEKLYHEEIVGITPIYYYTSVGVTKAWVTRTFAPPGEQQYWKWSIDQSAKLSARGG